MQQFIVDANTLDYPVGSIYYSITRENLDGIDAKAVNEHLLSRNRPQRIRILYTDGAGESASHNLEEFFTDVNIQHLQSVPGKSKPKRPRRTRRWLATRKHGAPQSGHERPGAVLPPLLLQLERSTNEFSSACGAQRTHARLTNDLADIANVVDSTPTTTLMMTHAKSSSRQTPLLPLTLLK